MKEIIPSSPQPVDAQVVYASRLRRVRIARVIAVLADAVQIGLFPLFAEGALSPLSDVLDVVLTVVFTALLGWHLAFLPTVIAKVIPIVDLAPTWTIAVFVVTRRSTLPPAPPALPPSA